MGIVKISDTLHEEVRKASGVMHRSINSQAEFWIKIGMMAELYLNLTFNELTSKLMSSASVSDNNIKSAEGVVGND
ncbi:ParD-like family protein [Vibrio sp. TH_r3]|uniref:ParD-like family protein n=1 Tax=Vibrio sp. TH_r3 TaxID=3082084 RepID=UPI002954C5EB|nr:ParD-like family protein [Vibrio sp. TH_r3]MDV7104630.1 ParD-like family protein [Vibrio sp. TH_r3]